MNIHRSLALLSLLALVGLQTEPSAQPEALPGDIAAAAEEAFVAKQTAIGGGHGGFVITLPPLTADGPESRLPSFNPLKDGFTRWLDTTRLSGDYADDSLAKLAGIRQDDPARALNALARQRGEWHSLSLRKAPVLEDRRAQVCRRALLSELQLPVSESNVLRLATGVLRSTRGLRPVDGFGRCLAPALPTEIAIPAGVTLREALTTVAASAEAFVWAAVDTGTSCDFGVLFVGEPEAILCESAVWSVKAADLPRMKPQR